MVLSLYFFVNQILPSSCGFRDKEVQGSQKGSPQKARISNGGHVCFVQDLPYIIHTKQQFIVPP